MGEGGAAKDFFFFFFSSFRCMCIVTFFFGLGSGMEGGE